MQQCVPRPLITSINLQVHIVIGAGSGIGKETAHRLAKEGAHIVAIDVDEDAAAATAAEITKKIGQGIGVAGSGVSGCGPAIGLRADVTDRGSIRAALDQVALAYGGFDTIVVTAGVFVPSDTTGHIPDEKWAQTFGVNVTGSYLVADEVWHIFCPLLLSHYRNLGCPAASASGHRGPMPRN